jgi:hypothetical protein
MKSERAGSRSDQPEKVTSPVPSVEEELFVAPYVSKEICGLFLDLGLHLADIATDWMTLLQFANSRHWTWFGLQLTFILFPLLVQSFFDTWLARQSLQNGDRCVLNGLCGDRSKQWPRPAQFCVVHLLNITGLGAAWDGYMAYQKLRAYLVRRHVEELHCAVELESHANTKPPANAKQERELAVPNSKILFMRTGLELALESAPQLFLNSVVVFEVVCAHPGDELYSAAFPTFSLVSLLVSIVCMANGITKYMVQVASGAMLDTEYISEWALTFKSNFFLCASLPCCSGFGKHAIITLYILCSMELNFFLVGAFSGLLGAWVFLMIAVNVCLSCLGLASVSRCSTFSLLHGSGLVAAVVLAFLDNVCMVTRMLVFLAVHDPENDSQYRVVRFSFWDFHALAAGSLLAQALSTLCLFALASVYGGHLAWDPNTLMLGFAKIAAALWGCTCLLWFGLGSSLPHLSVRRDLQSWHPSREAPTHPGGKEGVGSPHREGRRAWEGDD